MPRKSVSKSAAIIGRLVYGVQEIVAVGRHVLQRQASADSRHDRRY